MSSAVCVQSDVHEIPLQCMHLSATVTLAREKPEMLQGTHTETGRAQKKSNPTLRFKGNLIEFMCTWIKIDSIRDFNKMCMDSKKSQH